MQTLQGPYVYQHPHPLLFLGPHRSSLGSAGFDLPAVDEVHGSTLVSYNAGISACEKGEQWQRALALLSEVWEAKLEPDVISYNAGISACEKGEQWQRALALLSEMWEAKLEPDVVLPTLQATLRAKRASASNCSKNVPGLLLSPSAKRGRTLTRRWRAKFCPRPRRWSKTPPRRSLSDPRRP